ncbi:MAG: hypothetical protein ACAF41_09910 [Leptolyngbya sp. BL-A-14]
MYICKQKLLSFCIRNNVFLRKGAQPAMEPVFCSVSRSSLLLYRISLFNGTDSPIIVTTFTCNKVMPQFRPPLSNIAAIAIVSGALLLGSSMLVSACPFSGLGRFDSPENRNDSDRLSGADDRSRLSGNGGSEFSLRHSDEFKHRYGFGLMGDSKRLNVTEAEVAGLGAVIGLFVLAILYRVRQAYRLEPTEVALLSKYPFLEHPEMMLTLVPQEALSSAFEMESTTPRY